MPTILFFRNREKMSVEKCPAGVAGGSEHFRLPRLQKKGKVVLALVSHVLLPDVDVVK